MALGRRKEMRFDATQMTERSADKLAETVCRIVYVVYKLGSQKRPQIPRETVGVSVATILDSTKKFCHLFVPDFENRISRPVRTVVEFCVSFEGFDLIKRCKPQKASATLFVALNATASIRAQHPRPGSALLLRHPNSIS